LAFSGGYEHDFYAVPIRVFLCDDVPAMRIVLRAVLEEEGDLEVVGEAGDGEEAVTEIARLKPDVVVLDLSMPRLDGLEAIPRIHEVAPAARIVVFSGYAADRMEPLALAVNASRYVEKGRALEELREVVREVAEP
jgi:DNA-binding NarL/FixJ family response regulator